MNIHELKLTDIQPSQLYISDEKIRAVKKWFRKDDLSNFMPITIKELNGRIIFTDGHTRAWVAYIEGLERVPLAWEESDLDWEVYQVCVDACLAENVHSVIDFAGRTLSSDAYQEKWDKWCERLTASLEEKRIT